MEEKTLTKEEFEEKWEAARKRAVAIEDGEVMAILVEVIEALLDAHKSDQEAAREIVVECSEVDGEGVWAEEKSKESKCMCGIPNRRGGCPLHDKRK